MPLVIARKPHNAGYRCGKLATTLIIHRGIDATFLSACLDSDVLKSGTGVSPVNHAQDARATF